MYVRASGREVKVGLQNAGFQSIAALALPPPDRYSPIIAAKPPESPKNGPLAPVFACRGCLARTLRDFRSRCPTIFAAFCEFFSCPVHAKVVHFWCVRWPKLPFLNTLVNKFSTKLRIDQDVVRCLPCHYGRPYSCKISEPLDYKIVMGFFSP
jgi:hypothetical protein